MQMCAKIGGEPWALDKMPFILVPTMVVGIDVYNKNGKNIVGCCASFNNRFTKYLSIVKQENQDRDLDSIMRDCINEAIEIVNKIFKIILNTNPKLFSNSLID